MSILSTSMDPALFFGTDLQSRSAWMAFVCDESAQYEWGQPEHSHDVLRSDALIERYVVWERLEIRRKQGKIRRVGLERKTRHVVKIVHEGINWVVNDAI